MSDKRSALRAFLVWGGGLLLLALVTVAGFGIDRYLGERSIDGKVDNFFALYNSGKYGAIYDQSHARWQEIAPRERVVNALKGTHELMGDFRTKSRRSVRVSYSLEGKTTVADYVCDFSKGQGTAKFTFIRNLGQQRLAAYEFLSPVLQGTVFCPKCGALVKKAEGHCTSCGSLLSGMDLQQRQ